MVKEGVVRLLFVPESDYCSKGDEIWTCINYASRVVR